MSAEARTLWIVSPVFRDVPAFKQVREHVRDCLADHAELGALALRFVAVDDTAGADPEITELLEDPATMVVTAPFNLGHQRALVYGLRSVSNLVSEADLIVTMDADGEDRPEDLPRMLLPLAERPDTDDRTVVLARRTQRKEPLMFKVLYFFFRNFFWLLTGHVIRTGNYAAFRAWTARALLAHPYFDLCYSSTLIALHPAVAYVDAPRGERYAGESRMTYSKLVMHGLRMLMPFTDQIAIRALLTFTVAIGVSVVIGAAIAVSALATGAGVPTWAIIALLFSVLVSFIALGNFVLLFSVFSQSRGLSLARLEDQRPVLAGAADPYAGVAATNVTAE